MSFADDRALQALQGVLLTPSLAERQAVGTGLVDASSQAVPTIIIPDLEDVRDPLEDVDTRRTELQTYIPEGGTPSVISVATPSRELNGVAGGQGGGPGPFGGGRRNAAFILTAVTENLKEKYQIYQTFRGYILYSMGRAPSVYTFSGYVTNSQGRQGSIALLRFYERYLKASSAVVTGVPSSVSYLQTTTRGYVLGIRVQHQGASPSASQFSFDLLIQ